MRLIRDIIFTISIGVFFIILLLIAVRLNEMRTDREGMTKKILDGTWRFVRRNEKEKRSVYFDGMFYWRVMDEDNELAYPELPKEEDVVD